MNDDVLRQEILGLLPRLRRYAYALTGATHDADDLLQTTVERLLSRNFPDDVDLIKWSFRVCKNVWIDEIRARNVRVSAVVNDRIENSEMFDGERVVMGQMTFEEVKQTMDSLPYEQKAALSLVALEGFSYAETAEIMGAPVGTIMSRIARARSALMAMRNEDFLPVSGNLPNGVKS